MPISSKTFQFCRLGAIISRTRPRWWIFTLAELVNRFRSCCRITTMVHWSMGMRKRFCCTGVVDSRGPSLRGWQKYNTFLLYPTVRGKKWPSHGQVQSRRRRRRISCLSQYCIDARGKEFADFFFRFWFNDLTVMNSHSFKCAHADDFGQCC